MVVTPQLVEYKQNSPINGLFLFKSTSAFFAYILVHLLAVAISQPDIISLSYDYNFVGNYTNNSIYQANLNTLLSSLASDTRTDSSGFYNLSLGQSPDRVNLLALCRGDASIEDCRGCITNSTRKVLQACPNQKAAFAVYDLCMLRYSNRSIFGVVETRPPLILFNRNNVSDANTFNEALQELLGSLRSRAESGGSKFATGTVSAGFDTIYGMVQCTPDLDEQQCDDCLVSTIRQISACCGGQIQDKIGLRIINPSCGFRYQISRFYCITPTPPPSSSSPPNPIVEEGTFTS
ncbi:hypothetical protein Tsubulata_012557 [Turnera subulata]|uniref:Gnk2-homologous domain-containing protein n=1 Tax=Turnera subulata TaxID=218843 RepID=A0A9Q0JML8_9ROSI|nr:hypothetical protein Tsubulata_012557 [Turnera subulata]